MVSDAVWSVMRVFYNIVGQYIDFLFATELIPGFSIGTVLFGATVMAICLRVAMAMLKKPEADGASGSSGSWRKRA